MRQQPQRPPVERSPQPGFLRRRQVLHQLHEDLGERLRRPRPLQVAHRRSRSPPPWIVPTVGTHVNQVVAQYPLRLLARPYRRRRQRRPPPVLAVVEDHGRHPHTVRPLAPRLPGRLRPRQRSVRVRPKVHPPVHRGLEVEDKQHPRGRLRLQAGAPHHVGRAAAASVGDEDALHTLEREEVQLGGHLGQVEPQRAPHHPREGEEVPVGEVVVHADQLEAVFGALT